MTSKPLDINKNSWQYKLYTVWSKGSSPKNAWHYRCGLAIMIITYVFMALAAIIVVLAMSMIFLTAISPVYLHYWPGNRFFGLLHQRLWPDISKSLAICAVILPLLLLCYWQAPRFQRLGQWLVSHKPAPRPVRLVEE